MLHHRLRAAAGNLGGDITDPSHPDLIAMYTMDNISGSTLVDETSNGNDATIIGATAVAGLIGDALDFDGTDDDVVTPVVHSTTALSVALWVNPDALGSRQYLFGDYGPNGNNPGTRCTLYFDLFDGKYSIATGDGVDDGVGSWPNNHDISHGLSNGVWTFVVLNLDGSAAEIFENGVSVGAVTMGGSLGATDAAGDWKLGRAGDYEANPYYFNGQLDMCRRFGRALTPSEISELYNGGAGA